MTLKITGGSDESEMQPETQGRYTSYHSDKTLSILERARQDVKKNEGFDFEYNGIQYLMRPLSYNVNDKYRLISHGLMYKYLMPWSGGMGERNVLAEFDGDKFDQFIETFEIEGKTVRWILEHQKEWKYNLTAKHFEQILTGFSFTFFYRTIPCRIFSVGEEGKTRPGDGRYLYLLHGVQFDPSQYAPVVPGAKHWFDASGNLGVFHVPFEGAPDRTWISAGPFKTDGELLDTVQFNGKTLRKIFDTEYDDGKVFCGMFEG